MKHPLHVVFPVALVALLWANGSAAPTQAPADPSLPAVLESPGSVPVGTVLMWWGIEADLPAGFEICDGKFPLTKGAKLKERKPDLRDRFVKGARDFSTFRPQNAVSGGTNGRGELTTEPHIITRNELPKHTHPIAHTHTVPEHSHRIGSHTHAIGEFVSILFGPGPDGGIFLRQHSKPAPHTSEDAGPAGASTGQSLVLTTSAPSVAASGENTWTTGAQTGHTHVLRGGDSMPAFLEMIFIIRVK